MVEEQQSNTNRETTASSAAVLEGSSSPPRRSLLSRLRRHPSDRTNGGEPTPSTVVDLDDSSFSAALQGCATVADFWAPWCGPCKMLQPRFDELARAHRDDPRLQFVRIDVDASPIVAATLEVMSIPTVIVFDPSGRELERQVGLPSKRRLAQMTRGATSSTRSPE